MFNNMKIGTRLSIGFAFVVILLIVLSALSYRWLSTLNDELNNIVSDKFPKTVWANDVIDQVNIAARSSRNALLVKTKDEAQSELERVGGASKIINDRFEKLDKTIVSPEGKRRYEIVKEKRKVYAAEIASLTSLIAANKRDEATTQMLGSLRKAQNEYIDAIMKLIDYQTDLMNAAGKDADDLSNTAKRLILILSLGAILLTIGFAYWLIRSITVPTTQLVDAANKMAAGDFNFTLGVDRQDEVGQLAHAVENVQGSVRAMITDAALLSKAAVEGKLATRADASKHQGDFRAIVQGVNDTLDAVIGPLNVTAKYVDDISKGVIPPVITDNYNGDFNVIKTNLNNMVKMMSDLLAQTDIIIQGAANGELDKRANADLFVGGWNKLVVGVNATVTNIVDPLNVTADYVDKIAKGIIPPEITTDYKGQYNIIKGNLNNMVKMMNELLAQTDILIKGAAAGQLEKRANADLFVGGWNDLVTGVNNILNNVVPPIQDVRRVMAAMEQGDMTQTITRNYQGDFDELKRAINNTIAKLCETITQINTAADALTNAAS
ncbi:MCP four helix bundle domain-containing protein, partial [Propionivibrio dicarboxylicus]